jgi:CubicO group peptidase (beta-lactamase class C family)
MRLHLFIAAAAAASLLSTASALPAGTKDKLDKYVQSYADSGLFSGVVLVRSGKQTLLLKSAGVADRGFGVPVSPDTKFQIASLSKPMTSVAIGKLVDRGQLTYETTIGSLIPGIPNGDRITIEQLLTHFSGLDSPDRAKGSSAWFPFRQTTEQLVQRVRESKPVSEPGAKYEYSNANYWLLAAVIEKVSGQPYGDFLKREIFNPLGMKDTAHRADLLAVVPKLATGYQLDGPASFRVSELIDWTSKTGNGSIYSTAADIDKFYEAFVGGKLVKPETVARMRSGNGKFVGYGWFRKSAERDGRNSLWFNGRSPGYGAYLEGFDDSDTSFVLLSNLYTYAPTAMSEGIANILTGKPFEPMAPIRPYKMSTEQLGQFTQRYRFGPDFHVKNMGARVVVDRDHLKMQWDAGDRVSTLIPVSANTFFDPTFWATMTFVDAPGGKKIVYKSFGFSKTYEALPESQ